ncbi:MAG: heme exporter protein CcmD [Zoogloeaceae bacterium]|jgi:heme exporter protein D|nr:heme exporter protein CcmD [Zoogloeaceae bacterium]
MHWNSLSDFLAMGEHGLYVWGAFGMTALVMLLETWLTLRRQRAVRQRLARQLAAAMRENAQENAREKTGESGQGDAA